MTLPVKKRRVSLYRVSLRTEDASKRGCAMPDTDSAEQKQGRVTSAYSAQYTDPLIVRAGEPLIESARVEPWEDNPEWMWVWCSDARGKSGWVPRDYIPHDTPGAQPRSVLRRVVARSEKHTPQLQSMTNLA